MTSITLETPIVIVPATEAKTTTSFKVTYVEENYGWTNTTKLEIILLEHPAAQMPWLQHWYSAKTHILNVELLYGKAKSI